MEDILYYSNLFDYYGSLFTDIQRDYFMEYFFNNLSLQEIADNYKVSKNAVSKTINQIKNKLDNYENKLHLYHNKLKIKDLLDNKSYEKIESFI